MGYPMTYQSVVTRNHLYDGYDAPPRNSEAHLIAGDLRRFESDTLDDTQLVIYAESFGCSVEQARRGFRRFFGLDT